MTRLAVISDLHADIHALRDALAQIERLACDVTICLGDLIDYGLFPEETLALLRERRIPTIRGNHDRWAVQEGHDVSGWDLAPRAIGFLKTLPTSWRETIVGVRVIAWHARSGSDMAGIYADTAPDELEAITQEAAADVLIVGHTHIPLRRRARSGRLVVNPGCLLRDSLEHRSTGGTFGVLELPQQRFTVHDAATGEPLTDENAYTARRLAVVDYEADEIPSCRETSAAPEEPPARTTR